MIAVVALGAFALAAAAVARRDFGARRVLTRAALVSVLMGVAAFTVFGGFGDARAPVYLVPALILGGLAALLLRSSPTTPDGVWVSAGVRARVAFVAASPGRTVQELSRAEARAWFASPWFLIGLGFCFMQIGLFGWWWANDGTEGWRSFVVLYPIMAHPLTGMTVVAAHFAVTRSRRDGSEEIFAACPVDGGQRSASHLLAGWVPAAVGAVFVAVLTSVVSLRNEDLYGFTGSLVGDALAAVVLPWCGAALGVALARWARWPLVPLVFVAALVPAIIGLGNLGDPHWSNLRQLSTWPRYPNHDLLFTERHVWSHLVWLVALGALMAVLALLRTRRDRALLSAAGVVLASLVAAGLFQVRAIDGGAARRIASLVAEPAAHQSCRTEGSVAVCTYAGYEKYGRMITRTVAPVGDAVRRVRGSAPDTITFRQVFDGSLDALGPEVGAALRGRTAPRGDLRLGYATGSDVRDAVRLTVAVAAVGLPTTANVADRAEVIAGRSQGVVALWLAAQGLAPKAQRRIASTRFDPNWEPDDYQPTAYDRGNAWPDVSCETGPAPVIWSAEDLDAARRVIALPPSTVTQVLATQWTRLTSPAASTNDLLAALSLPTVASFENVVAERQSCTY